MRPTFVHTVPASLLLALAGVLAVFPLTAHAHTTGASWNITSGPYTVDLGYNPLTFIAGEYASFDFLLWKGPANTGEQTDYAQVWVRIIRDKNTLLATGILHQTYGPTTLLYSFAEPGDYTLEASFRTESGDEIAVATFPLSVSPASDQLPLGPYLLPLLSGVCGLIGGFLLTRFSPRFRLSKHTE